MEDTMEDMMEDTTTAIDTMEDTTQTADTGEEGPTEETPAPITTMIGTDTGEREMQRYLFRSNSKKYNDLYNWYKRVELEASCWIS